MVSARMLSRHFCMIFENSLASMGLFMVMLRPMYLYHCIFRSSYSKFGRFAVSSSSPQ